MSPSRVYSMNTNGRSLSSATGLVAQMVTLFDAAGFADMIKPGDAVAIKLHCGEWNNTAYLRPVYARTLADRIKALGGRPFVCDTTTLTYGRVASRVTGLDLLLSAERNGYTSGTLGCPFIVADGYNGTDDLRVDLPEGYILKEAYIAKAIALADVLIALTHFKGHPLGVIGGSLKNLGIGAQSKRGKQSVHMGGHPKYGFGAATDYHPERCKGRACAQWELCEHVCPHHLFHVTEDSITWERDRCTGCLAHLGATTRCGVCDFPEITYRATSAAIADGCLGAVKAVGRGKVGFINMAIDVSPACDCVGFADMPIVPPLGVFASSDPVALDKASVDKAREAPGMPGSAAVDYGAAESGARKFTTASAVHFTDLSEEIQIQTGARNGLGSTDYEIVEVAPTGDNRFWAFPDQRDNAIKYAKTYAKDNPFPYERHDGHGFLRAEEVDLDTVNLMD
jgi:uncharacterized Fe-S center protein